MRFLILVPTFLSFGLTGCFIDRTGAGAFDGSADTSTVDASTDGCSEGFVDLDGNPDNGCECERRAETCNGTDEDCDRSVDEDLSRACRLPASCGAGVQLCVDASWTECAPVDVRDEVCGGGDEDCDRAVDEGCACSGGPRECGPSDGVCEPGTQTCTADGWGPCEGGVPPSAETCNGLDDDCDGTADGFDEACSENVGICTAGTRTCTAGEWGECSGVTPRDEVCDAEERDENCNGRSNEECRCEEGDTEACEGVAGCVGVRSCNPATGEYEGECVVTGVEESCNGVDDDCNGVIDDAGADCPDVTGCFLDRFPDGRTYLFCYDPDGSGDEERDFEAARDYCARFGYHLARINGMFENESLAAIADDVGSGDWWIGLHDLDDDGNYTWLVGPAGGFSLLGGEPEAGDCVTLDVSNENWKTKDCDDVRSFICEAPPRI